MEIVWSRVADRDLAQVYGYLEERSMRAARDVLRQIFKAVDALAEMPRMGRVSDLEMEREYRELVVGNLKLFYFIEGHQVVIARLWDSAKSSQVLHPKVLNNATSNVSNPV